MPRRPHRVFENMTTGPWLVELRGDQNVLGELFDHFYPLNFGFILLNTLVFLKEVYTLCKLR